MIEIKEKGEFAVITFAEKITALNVYLLRDESLSAKILDKTDKTKFIIDMARVEHLDSGALGRIIGIYKALTDKNGVMALINMNGNVLNLIQMVRLDKIIMVFDTEQKAIDHLSS